MDTFIHAYTQIAGKLLMCPQLRNIDKTGGKKESSCAIFPLVILLLLNFSHLRLENVFKIALDFYGNAYSEFSTAPLTVKYFKQIQSVLLFNCPFRLLQDLITEQKTTSIHGIQTSTDSIDDLWLWYAKHEL